MNPSTPTEWLAQAEAEHVPAWLALLQAIAAWIASLLIVGSFFTPLLLLADEILAYSLAAVLLLGTALLLFRLKSSLFFGQVALAFSLAGQLLVQLALQGDSFWRWHDTASLLWSALLAFGLALLPSTALHRSLCLLIAVGLTCWALGAEALQPSAWLISAAACGLWLSRRQWATQRHAPLLKATVHALSVSSLVMAGLLGSHGPWRETLNEWSLTPSLPLLGPYAHAVVSALILLATCFWLSRAWPRQERLTLLIGASLFGLFLHPLPGLLGCAALALAAFQGNQRTWSTLAWLAALMLLAEFYYNLQLSLLGKSAAMATGGFLLLGLHLLLRRSRQ